MLATAQDVERYVSSNLNRFLKDLRTFCRIPSVTSDERSVRAMADVLESRLRASGLEVTRGQVNGGHPSFIATMTGRSDRRLLFFNHYDVDPPGEIDLWESPPFEPRLDGDRFFARGAADNKGSLLSRLHAVEALLELDGSLPCGVTLLIEAKQSIYGEHLGAFVNQHRDLLRADACLWENSTVSADGRPTFRLGDKGILVAQIVSRGTSLDLSSQYAPIFPSAAWNLVTLFGEIKGPDGRVRLPGFYEDVLPWSRDELELIEAVPIGLAELEARAGVALPGLSETEARIAYYTEPTANIATLSAGPKTGQEMMSVNPSEARAVIDLRLVPNQDPAAITEQLEELAERCAGASGSIEVEVLGVVRPIRTSLGHPFVRDLVRAATETYGNSPILEPISPTTSSRSVLAWSSMPVAGYGISYHGSNIQAPNEHIRLSDYTTGIRFLAHLLETMGHH